MDFVSRQLKLPGLGASIALATTSATQASGAVPKAKLRFDGLASFGCSRHFHIVSPKPRHFLLATGVLVVKGGNAAVTLVTHSTASDDLATIEQVIKLVIFGPLEAAVRNMLTAAAEKPVVAPAPVPVSPIGDCADRA